MRKAYYIEDVVLSDIDSSEILHNLEALKFKYKVHEIDLGLRTPLKAEEFVVSYVNQLKRERRNSEGLS